MRGRQRAWKEAMLVPLPPLPPQAVFKPKYSLPKLDSYMGKFKANYWAKWRMRKLTRRSKDRSWVSASGLRDLASRAGLRDQGIWWRECVSGLRTEPTPGCTAGAGCQPGSLTHLVCTSMASQCRTLCRRE